MPAPFAAFLAALALIAVPTASANTGSVIAPQHPPNYTPLDGWQAGTCKTDTPTCSVATKSQFFEQAAAHPQVGFTQFIVRQEQADPPSGPPVAELKRVRVDLPVGLSVNPGATPRCPSTTFEASGAAACTAGFPGSQVGESLVTAYNPLPIVGGEVAPIPGVTQVPVFNLVPKAGQPARFGLELAGNKVYLEADVAWEGDFHEGFTIEVPQALPLDLKPLVNALILKNRLTFDGRSGDGTFITTPSTCLGESGTGPGKSGSVYSTLLRAGSYAEFATPGYSFPAGAEPFFESPIPPGTSPKECGTIPYGPKLAVDPRTALTDSPAGAAVTVTVPHLLPDYGAGANEQDNSVTKQAEVTLPVGFGINPAAAEGLAACDDFRFPLESRTAVTCPAASKIGTVTISSPPLPEGDLTGNVYVGRQLSRDPLSGEEYRIFIAAESARYDVSVRLLGRVRADPLTGRLHTTIADVPQVPFTSFALAFDGGPRAVLSSPPICDPGPATSAMTPWSGNGPSVPTGPFKLSAAPGGGACAKAMADRPFAPSFSLAPRKSTAGEYSPLTMRIARSDGQQELKGVDVTLPPGVTGKLAGLEYCPARALATASSKAGAAEAADASCPSKSFLGDARILAGTGPAPLRIDGKVFLSGPYRGAPLSLAVVTPATAGPFDLGTVVVRAALFVDPESAQIHVVSDPLPDVFGGTKLSIRSVDVSLDRKEFSLNPTNCEASATAGVLRGGGSNPAVPAAFSSAPVSSFFRATDCGPLKFRPKLKTKLLGGRKATRRTGHPKLSAVLTARPGDADVARASLTLPHSIFLDQGSLNNVCIRPRLAAVTCPKSSVYGFAEARTPLLDEPLRGPVYLVSSDNELPDLLADLKGQVDIRLRAIISGKKGKLKTTFARVPDVPVSKFALTMRGGKRGLLENSRNLCGKRQFSYLSMRAQNGKPRKVKRLPLRVASCRVKGKGRAVKDKD